MPSNGRLYRQIALLGAIGVTVAVASAGGFVLGTWLDGKLGTKPWLTLVLGLMGIGAAFINLFRTLAQAERLEQPAPEDDGDDDAAGPGRP